MADRDGDDGSPLLHAVQPHSVVGLAIEAGISSDPYWRVTVAQERRLWLLLHAASS
jgi:hypothetical protein